MSLSLIMTASNRVGLRSCFLADVATESATFRHVDGVQAGVCQRIFSFTEQMVLARQLSEAMPLGVDEVSAAVVLSGVAGEAERAPAAARTPNAARLK
ncbi:MAG TPA: hypothetical protein VHJ20_09125 [Polyangia bacterium]|nr:hypothetical protein [Polyangia bacterium]